MTLKLCFGWQKSLVFNELSYFCKFQENICIGGKHFVGLVYINVLVNNGRAKLKKSVNFLSLCSYVVNSYKLGHICTHT